MWPTLGSRTAKEQNRTEPKLLYLLRTSHSSDNPLLRQFDDTLWTGLITILNVDIDNDQCSKPHYSSQVLVWKYGVLRRWHLLPLLLQQSILHDSIWMQGDQSVASTETLWTGLANSPKPSQQTQHTQKAWDGPVAANQKNLILSIAPSDVDKARLLAAASPHSGDWLHHRR